MKSIVLLSAGLDSALNLALACKRTDVIKVITFDYGQKAAGKEIYYSCLIASYYKVEHLEVKLPFYKDMKNLGLIEREAPEVQLKDLNNDGLIRNLSFQVWIPNRNAVFVNIAAAFAEYFGADLVVTGFNREESQSFPDNSSDFLDAVNFSLTFSTQKKVRTVSYTLSMTKKEIVNEGIKLKLPWEYIWSCYNGEELMCGKCESCQRLIRAAQESPAWRKLRARFKNA